MGAVALAARIVLALTLLYSGVVKLTTRARLDAMVPFVPASMQPLFSVAVPALEIAVAFALFVFIDAAWPAWCALVLLIAFTVVLLRTLTRPERAPCNCFGTARSGTVTARTLVRNATLIALALAAALW